MAMEAEPKTKADAMDGGMETGGRNGRRSATPLGRSIIVRIIDNRSDARRVVRGPYVSIPSGPAARKRPLSNARRVCTSRPVDRSKFGWKFKAVSGGPRVRRREGCDERADDEPMRLNRKATLPKRSRPNR